MSAFVTDLLHILQNPYIALIFFTALVFDFINGFHDAANSIATIVGTRVLRPFQAVCWAAWWNFAAAWFFGVHVANAVATWVHADYVTVEVIKWKDIYETMEKVTDRLEDVANVLQGVIVKMS